MDQNQPSGSTTSNSNGIFSPTQAMRQMLESFSQRMSHQMANYFFVPPMAGTHNQQQQLRQEGNNQDRTMASNRRRQHQDDHETVPMVLDDSDDAILFMGEVKSKYQ